MPGEDLQGEEVVPTGLDIDYFLGKRLPKGAGGYINYDHDPTQIVGYPEEGKIGPQGFWIKWRTLDTPFVHKIMEQMRALKKANWPRRYGMSIEGVVHERDPENPHIIRRAFIKNVALTPTPVHPGTFVDFAKSLTTASEVGFDPTYGRAAALRGWVTDVVAIQKGLVTVRGNPYFTATGRFRPDQDVAYFREVWGQDAASALDLGHFAVSRQAALQKALADQRRWDGWRRHLVRQRRRDPTDPHVTAAGQIRGGDHAVAAHFLSCEGRTRAETVRIVRALHGSPVVQPVRQKGAHHHG
ncbi:hypothetical protein [Sulfobacillus harzensis]|uniref:Uncharacterized protein n=1 Tax=Sulfobacillus harzensis TaxID=2729629 RepID=A0A7Y0KZW8_9FIRM|nr:hypothetical protein [Sulfobacillus harzensis]NMP20759.1 hypothetical protein [Sulfobacillus harzensis]